MTEEQFQEMLKTCKFVDKNGRVEDYYGRELHHERKLHVLGFMGHKIKELGECVGDIVSDIVYDIADHLTFHPRSSYFDTAYGSRKRDFEFWHGKGSWERNR